MTRTSLSRSAAIALGGVCLAGSIVAAYAFKFSQFTPLAASAGPTADESMPITFGNAGLVQQSIIDRASRVASLVPDTGAYDMITLNERGPQRNRYLFSVYETGQAGVIRHDRVTGQTDTIWFSPAVGGHVAFDAAYWTPWNTFITAEESWCTAPAGCTSNYGRLFELTNPLDAPALTNDNPSNAGADFHHRNVIPRTSHEGIQFDRQWNMYFIDELNGGGIYKYTSKATPAEVKAGLAGFFDAGQTFVLRVGDGLTPNAVGAFQWVPITDEDGLGLPGTLTITDGNGVTSVDARNTMKLAAFKGTEYQRPEDLQIVPIKGTEYLFVATTTTNEVYRINLKTNRIEAYANRATIDLATGSAVGEALWSPDNLAVDAEGNLYIIEDRNGGTDDDIWFARDVNRDGDLNDAGEGLGRWATNGTPGSEFTGLYFHPRDKGKAWVNIQHPTSTNDRMIEISIP